jgi:predicted Zn-dependent peptidase
MRPAPLDLRRAALGAALLAAALALPRATPLAAQAPAGTAPGGLTQPPPLGAAPSLKLPPATVRTLPNGLRLVVVEQRELPIVDAVLIVPTGGEADPAGREGLATLTANLLDEGTTSRTSLQIADQAAYLGASLGTSAAWDVSQLSLHAPAAQLDSALALMADVATRPSFPESDFERLRKERLTGLLQLRDRGPALADRAFAQQVFGAAHPYGRALSGTEASTRAVTRADVQRFYAAHWTPQAATLLVVGDVRADDLARRVARAFGAWQGAQDVANARRGTAVPAAPAPRATAVYLVDKPDAPQTSVRIGLVGVARDHPDYFPLEVMNTILGGSFTSRLNQNLRETKGYTYGAGSDFDMRRAAGPFLAAAEVTGAKTDSSLVEFVKELRAIGDTVPQGELEKAKQYLQLQLPGGFETTRGIAGRLASLIAYDLPLDWYDSYVARVGAVTQADVRRVARERVDASKFVIVVVGDRKSVEPAVRALNLGPLTVVPTDAVLGAPVAAPAAGTGGN